MIKSRLLFLLFLTFFNLSAQNGIFKTYFASGKVASRLSYINDVLEGESYWYYENGNLKTEKNYSNGALNGFSKMFYKNGLLKKEIHYLNGILDGISKEYYDNGSLKETRSYNNGQLVRITKLDYDSLYIAPLSAYEEGKGRRNKDANDFICPLEICPEPVGGIEEIEENIVYPDLALQYELEGTVLITAFINPKGEASNIKVIKSLGLGCDEAAIEAVKKTKFVPGRINGEEVGSEVSFKLNFMISRESKISQNTVDLNASDSISGTKEDSGSFIRCDVEICPEPIGGIVELLNKLRYPPQAKRNKIIGEVIVKAKIDELGFVVSTEIIKGLGYGCDQEAKSVVLKTQFIPGKINGTDSASDIEITIPFILEE